MQLSLPLVLSLPDWLGLLLLSTLSDPEVLPETDFETLRLVLVLPLSLPLSEPEDELLLLLLLLD